MRTEEPLGKGRLIAAGRRSRLTRLVNGDGTAGPLGPGIPRRCHVGSGPDIDDEIRGDPEEFIEGQKSKSAASSWSLFYARRILGGHQNMLANQKGSSMS
jgi:hypothetical protein